MTVTARWLTIGAFLLALCAAPQHVRAQGCADTTAPTIDITSPARGEQIAAGDVGVASINVVGEVSDDESPISSILLNGVELLSAQGGLVEPISVTIDSNWGMNTLVAVATDACGNSARVVQSFIRGSASNGFYPPSIVEDANAAAVHGIRVRLGPDVIDDGDRSDLDDLATFLEIALGGVDLESVLPIVIQEEDLPKCNSLDDYWVSNQTKELRITRGSLTQGSLSIDSIKPTSDGLEVKGSLSGLSTKITIRAYECIAGNRNSFGFSGDFELTNARVTVVGDATVTGGQAEVTISSSSTSTDDISFSVNCTNFQSLCDSVANAIVGLFESSIENKIANKIENKIPGTVEPFLESVEVERIVALPAPLDKVVRLRSALDEVAIRSGFVRIGNSTQFHPTSRGAGIPASAPGSLRRFGVQRVGFTGTKDLAVSAMDDLLNQLLWSLWYGGFLDIDDLGDLLSQPGVESLSISAGLPPVLMPGPAPDGAKVGLGDLFFDVTVDTGELSGVPNIGILSLQFWLSGVVDGHVFASGARQKFGFVADSAQVDIQLVDISEPALAGPVTPVLESFLEDLLPKLVDSFVGHLPLPVLPIEQLGGAPGRALSMTGPVADRPTDRDGTRIEGDVTRVPICGDGLIVGSEECDDGNRRFEDGCDASCDVETGWACSGEPSVCQLLCGNGTIDAGEVCDDGARSDGDGCDATCQREPGYDCVGEPSACVGTGAPVFLRRMIVKNKLPDEPDKNRVVIIAKDGAVPQPAPGAADDPRCSVDGGGGAGGRIAVRMASGEEYKQNLPCEGWKLLGKPAKPKGYKYLDRELAFGACKLVQVKAGKLVKALCLGKGITPLTLDLVETIPQDPSSVELRLGSESFYCAEAATDVTKDGSDGKTFLAKDQPAPPSCP